MAKNNTNLFFLIGGIVALVGVFLYYFDQSFAIWQGSIDWGFFGVQQGYLDPFGSFHVENVDPESWGNSFMIAAGLVIVGGLLSIGGGIKGTKSIGILGAIAILGGCLYCAYSLYTLFDGAIVLADMPLAWAINIGIDNLDGNIFMGSNNAETIVWRLGNGFFIIAVGAIVSLVGASKSS
ncbi:MAG: hypothetical protein GY870_17915 [archaeon]|nr:hypothetical protein [archaeon]